MRLSAALAAVMALALLLAAAPAAAQDKDKPAQQKFALIIANFDYDGDGETNADAEGVTRSRERGYVGDLANPWFDSVRVGEALERAGFAVETIRNADRAMMVGSIASLRARAQAAGPTSVTVIYYAGHGIQVFGRNYLVAPRVRLADLPTGVDDLNEAAATLGPSLQELFAGSRFPQAPGYDLVLIDACRDNPWEEQVREALADAGDDDYAGERAFGALAPSSDRLVIGFSAQPGQLAQDGYAAASSPFANAISSRASERGLAIDQLLSGVMGEVAAASGAGQIPTVVGRLGDATSLAP